MDNQKLLVSHFIEKGLMVWPFISDLDFHNVLEELQVQLTTIDIIIWVQWTEIMANSNLL